MLESVKWHPNYVFETSIGKYIVHIFSPVNMDVIAIKKVEDPCKLDEPIHTCEHVFSINLVNL